MTALPSSRGAWAWLVVGTGPVEGATATGALRTPDGEPAGSLSVSLGRRRPARDALRVDPAVVDLEGPAWAISLVVPPADQRPLFDDPAVVGATRAALAGTAAVAFVSSLVVDPTRWCGSVSGTSPEVAAGWPAWYDRDPFRRLAPGRSLLLDAGVLGAVSLGGPGTQRYAGAPWPHVGFPDRPGTPV